MAEAFVDVFRENSKLILDVKPKFIERLIEILRAHTVSTPNVLVGLRMVAKVCSFFFFSFSFFLFFFFFFLSFFFYYFKVTPFFNPPIPSHPIPSSPSSPHPHHPPFPSQLENEGIPMRRNQDLIIKNLMQFKDTVVRAALIDDARNTSLSAQRLDLLRYSGKVRIRRYLVLNVVYYFI